MLLITSSREETAHPTEVSCRDRPIGRPTLADLFAAVADKSVRDLRIRKARDRFHYRVSEIVRHVSLHSSLLVSRVHVAPDLGEPGGIEEDRSQFVGNDRVAGVHRTVAQRDCHRQSQSEPPRHERGKRQHSHCHLRGKSSTCRPRSAARLRWPAAPDPRGRSDGAPYDEIQPKLSSVTVRSELYLKISLWRRASTTIGKECVTWVPGIPAYGAAWVFAPLRWHCVSAAGAARIVLE